MKIVCVIRYQIDPFQRDEFKKYAENWGRIIPKCGGDLIGYFLPSDDVAWGLIGFDSLADYGTYRGWLKSDPGGRENCDFAQSERLILREERNFVELLDGTCNIPAALRSEYVQLTYYVWESRCRNYRSHSRLELTICPFRHNMTYTASSNIKQVVWIGSSKAYLIAFPEEVKDAMGYALYVAQQGGQHYNAKPLRSFGGAGILEIVEDHDGGTSGGVFSSIGAPCVCPPRFPEKIKERD